MGDKQRARDIAAAAGVPTVPGSRRFEPGDLEGLEDAGREIGYPLLVKASAGGGGIGMRRVDRSEEHTSELQSLMRISYAVFCLKKKKHKRSHTKNKHNKGTLRIKYKQNASTVSEDYN